MSEEVWLTLDCSDGEPQVEISALKFASTELATECEDVFDYVAVLGHALQWPRWRGRYADTAMNNFNFDYNLSCDAGCAHISAIFSVWELDPKSGLAWTR